MCLRQREHCIALGSSQQVPLYLRRVLCRSDAHLAFIQKATHEFGEMGTTFDSIPSPQWKSSVGKGLIMSVVQIMRLQTLPEAS